MPANKAYLGDGCYVSFDGYSLWLTTENGISTTNEICLEPGVYRALVEYVEILKSPAAADEADLRAEPNEREGD